MFFRRSLPFVLCLLFLALPAAAFAQTTPSVSVELASQQAAVGETIAANVVIRNGANIAGADVGVETGDCLRIVSKTQGSYLPDPSSGGFTVFDQMTDHSARLAVAITDRAAIANADGVFFGLELEVVCGDSNAAVDINVAELSAYADPTAEQIELVAYTRDAGTLTAASAQVALSAPTGAASGTGAVAQDSAETTETIGANAADPIDANTDGAQPVTNDVSAANGTQPADADSAQAIDAATVDSPPATSHGAATDGSVTELPPVRGTAQDSAESTPLALLAAIVLVTAGVAAIAAILIYRAATSRR